MTARELASRLLALPDPDVRVFIERYGSDLGSCLDEVAGTLCVVGLGGKSADGENIEGPALILTNMQRAAVLQSH